MKNFFNGQWPNKYFAAFIAVFAAVLNFITADNFLDCLSNYAAGVLGGIALVLWDFDDDEEE